MKSFKKIIFSISCAGGMILLSVFLINVRINAVSGPYIYSDAGKVPKEEVVLILGASVFADGRLSDMLKDRADTAIELYRDGKAGKILASGDHGTDKYDETNAMKKYLLASGIPPEDIFLDYAGFDTYDSLYRAKEIFKVRSLIITTQNFHLPRAVYIARSLGLEAYGLSADKHLYGGVRFNEAREIPADVKAFLDINLGAKPKFLGEQIPISGPSAGSWE